MINLYTWATPNGRKVSIMLEELGLEYNVCEVDISKKEQHDPAFIEISPNNKIPVITDSEGPDGQPFNLFESGAILIYLAEKTGSKLLPSDPRNRAITMQWLMFQMGGVGPMFGQAHVFLFKPKEDLPSVAERYHRETKRLYSVINHVGNFGDGHYFTFSRIGDKWYCFNDSSMSPTSIHTVLNQDEAYLLFYNKNF